MAVVAKWVELGADRLGRCSGSRLMLSALDRSANFLKVDAVVGIVPCA